MNTADMAREFTVVPAGDILYSHLKVLRTAGWNWGAAPTTGDSSDKSTTMTRYEMALEVTKALIAIRARQNADARWTSTLPATSLRSLRALCVELQPELTRFDVDAKATIAQLDAWLQPPATSTTSSNLVLSSGASSADAVAEGDSTQKEAMLKLPLSQRLRVYGAISSLARSSRDPLQTREFNTSSGALRLGNAAPETFGRLGGEYSITDRIQLRGEVSRRPVAGTLREALEGGASASGAGSEHSFGGGVDVALWPGVTLSGDVAHFETPGGLLPGLAQFNGMKYEGGVGLTGWQNRVALSANLSRLVPEDSFALSMSAAQLNLDVGLTQQISLKLLYQQLFETPQQSRGGRMIAGGININF
jgi:hypothetical protein